MREPNETEDQNGNSQGNEARIENDAVEVKLMPFLDAGFGSLGCSLDPLGLFGHIAQRNTQRRDDGGFKFSTDLAGERGSVNQSGRSMHLIGEIDGRIRKLLVCSRHAFIRFIGGLKAFDVLGWLHESSADYLERAADDYLRLTKGGTDLESVLVVSPTWAENHRLTDAIRSRLKADHQLAQEGAEFSVHDSLQWTIQQKRKAANYQPGQSIVFTRPIGDWKAGESAEVRRVEDGNVTVVTNGVESPLPIKVADCFDVGRSRAVEVSLGDKLLVRANAKRTGLINGQVLTVDKIEADGSVATREGVRIPSAFRQWCHGYVVTSHKAQGRTHKHVVVAAERLDAKSAYVACSRGQISCTVHTPDKARLLEHLPEGTRRAALDALSESIKQSPQATTSREIKASVSASENLVPTATQETAEIRHRWSEKVRRRILGTIEIVRRHRFITKRRRLALGIATKQTQSQHQNQHAQRQRSSVRMRI